jgi:hypothetical protein
MQEPGLKLNIYWPILTNYTTPGPVRYAPLRNASCCLVHRTGTLAANPVAV